MVSELEPTPVDDVHVDADTRIADETVAPRRDPAALAPGTELGRYYVLEHLGAGGMGVVYSAYDPKLDRKVAIKLLHATSRSREALVEGKLMNRLFGDPLARVSEVTDDHDDARLLREAQALAKLAHPNVVTVHDVGIWRGRIFVAMEFIDGRTLRRWVADESRHWREIVRVMIRAGRGLAAAHAVGLVHRDFKPDNVMVGVDGRVRVMDFGLARSTAALPASNAAVDGNDPARETMSCALLGTPAYMAPEQLRREPADPRTDQFAFGVTLWELLVGQRPFQGKSITELAATVLAGEVTPAPTSDVPAWLLRIAARAFARDRSDRFDSMDVLLVALGRDPGRTRRRLALFSAAAVLAITGVVGQRVVVARRSSACDREGDAIGEVWSEPMREQVRAGILATGIGYGDATWQRIEPRFDAYANEWSEMRTQACLATEVEGTRAQELLADTRECLDEGKLVLAKLLDRLVQADAAAVRNAVASAVGLPRLARCRDDHWLRQRLATPTDEASRAGVAVVRDRLAEANAADGLGHRDVATAIASAAVVDAIAVGWPPLVAEAQLEAGEAAVGAGSYARARTLLESAYVVAGRAGADETAAIAATQLVVVLAHHLGRRDEGRAWAMHARMLLGRLGMDQRGLLAARLETWLGYVDHLDGHADAAVARLRHALELYEEILGTEDLGLTSTLGALGAAEAARGNFDAALGHHRRTLAIQERELGPGHPDVATTLMNLGNVEGRRLHSDAALAYHRRALEIRMRALGADHPDVARDRANVCGALLALGRLDEARTECEQARRQIERAQGPDHPNVGLVLHNLGLIERSAGAYEASLQYLTRALAISEKALGPDHPHVARTLQMIAEVELLSHRPAAALPHLERVFAIRTAQPGDPVELAETQQALARALWDSGRDRSRALRLARAARGAFRSAAASTELADVEGWLAEHRG